MGNGTRSSAGRPGGGPGRLPTHRLVLAMALISTGPPLVIHEGWRGLPVAVAAVVYAAYLLLGKRWPRLRRRRVKDHRDLAEKRRTVTGASISFAIRKPFRK